MACNEKKSIAQVVSGAVCGVIMILCILVYLVLGLTINFWHPGWLIIVGGAFADAIISIIINTVSDVKHIKNKVEPDDEA